MAKSNLEPTNSSNSEESLREFLDSGDLAKIETKLRARLKSTPQNTELLWALFENQRSQGQLTNALGTLCKFLHFEPNNSHAQFMLKLLSNDALPTRRSIPSKFLRLRNFFPEELVESIQDHVTRNADKFTQTKVQRPDGHRTYDSTDRRSLHCQDVGELEQWLRQYFEAKQSLILKQLDMEPMKLGVYSCKYSLYQNGHFFGLHQDRSDGVAMARKLGFIYYFEFPPRRFHGGELVVYDRDPDTLLPASRFTTILPEHNSLVLLPANAWHEVLPVVCHTQEWNAGRFTFSGWLMDEALLEPVQ